MQKFVIAAGLALTACSNPHYCADKPDHNCNESDTPTDGKMTDGMEALDCVAMGGCTGGKVCDMDTHACVACTATDIGMCGGTAPICQADTCRACSANIQCSSDACMPDGSCAEMTDVAYVKVAGGVDNATCDKANPCATLGAGIAAKHIVRADGNFSQSIAITTGSYTLLGSRDAGGQITTTNASQPSLLSVSTGASITVRDVGFINSTANAVTSSGTLALDRCEVNNATLIGIQATGGMLTLTRSQVYSNHGGGIDLQNATFAITNAFVIENGNATSAFGGVSIYRSSGSLDFSTIANNTGSGATATAMGVTCAQTGAMVFNSDIVYANGNNQSDGAACTYKYSNLFGVGAPAASGTNLNTTLTFTGAHDYHLASGSPVRDMADPNATLPNDIDGDARPQGNARDIGADELMP